MLKRHGAKSFRHPAPRWEAANFFLLTGFLIRNSAQKPREYCFLPLPGSEGGRGDGRALLGADRKVPVFLFGQPN